MTYQNPKAIYACVNNVEGDIPKEIKEQSICLTQDIFQVINDLQEG